MDERTGRSRLRRPGRSWALLTSGAMVALGAVGCGHAKNATAPPPSTVVTTTTVAVTSRLTVVGVRPGVDQPPFYPQTIVTSVSCGTGPQGRFVRLDLPAGSTGTPAHSAMTEMTAVVAVPKGAVLFDQSAKALYTQFSRTITTATQGVLVLALQSVLSRNGHGLAVPSGVVQVNGDYTCPATDVAYPGT